MLWDSTHRESLERPGPQAEAGRRCQGLGEGRSAFGTSKIPVGKVGRSGEAAGGRTAAWACQGREERHLSCLAHSGA